MHRPLLWNFTLRARWLNLEQEDVDELPAFIVHVWPMCESWSAIPCCLGLWEAPLKYLSSTVRADDFPWCTSPAPVWRRRWKRPLFLSLQGMLMLFWQSGRHHCHFIPGMSQNQSDLVVYCWKRMMLEVIQLQTPLFQKTNIFVLYCTIKEIYY